MCWVTINTKNKKLNTSKVRMILMGTFVETTNSPNQARVRQSN